MRRKNLSVLAPFSGTPLLIIALASAACGDGTGPLALARGYKLATANGQTPPAMVARDSAGTDVYETFLTRSSLRFMSGDSAVRSFADSSIHRMAGSPEIFAVDCTDLHVAVSRSGSTLYLDAVLAVSPSQPLIIVHDTLVVTEGGRLTRDTKLSGTLPVHLEYAPADSAAPERDCGS